MAQFEESRRYHVLVNNEPWLSTPNRERAVKLAQEWIEDHPTIDVRVADTKVGAYILSHSPDLD